MLFDLAAMGDHNIDGRSIIAIRRDFSHTVQDVVASYYMSEDRMFAIQMLARNQTYKELTTIRISPSIRHANQA